MHNYTVNLDVQDIETCVVVVPCNGWLDKVQQVQHPA